MNRYAAELIGTFWPVLGGCGSTVLAAGLLGAFVYRLIGARALTGLIHHPTHHPTHHIQESET